MRSSETLRVRHCGNFQGPRQSGRLASACVSSSVAAITALVTEIQIEIEQFTARGRHREIHVFHNSPRAAAHYEVASQRLLPLDAAWKKRLSEIPWPNSQL